MMKEPKSIRRRVINVRAICRPRLRDARLQTKYSV